MSERERDGEILVFSGGWGCYVVPHVHCQCLIVTGGVVWRMSSSQTSTTHIVRIASKSHVQQTM